MKRSIKLLLILLLCVGCQRDEVHTPSSDTHPSISTTIPLPNDTSDKVVNRVEEDISKATSFDETIDESLAEYFQIQGLSNDESNIEMHRSSSTLRLYWGDNPKVQATLVSRSIFNAAATYSVDYDVCKVVIEYVPGEKDVVINVTGKNGDSERLDYNMKEDTILVSEYDSYVYDAVDQFMYELRVNPLVLSETFEYVKYLMENAYHVQDDDYVLNDEIVMEIQKLVARSGVYTLPLSFTHTQYSMFIKDDINMLIMIDGYNNIIVDYYKYETINIPYNGEELPVTLIYANGFISFTVSGYESQRYEYMNGEVQLVANDGDEAISLGIENELLAISKEYESEYSSVNLKLIELISEIEELILKNSSN